ncbi:MAG TPA: amidase [Chitinophagaceae bacterium]|nr:amidase [Chitinophagaceae bacterium]
MDRRSFLKNSTVAGIAATSAAVIAGCNTPGDSAKNNTGDDAAKAGYNDFALNEATIEGLQDKMKSGELTSRSITEMYVKRIDAIDKNGPKINSVIELNPDALSIADAMDSERKAGKLRGPLHGIPVLIKDNISTGDKMMTTAGALALVGHKAAKDAFIIQQLRAAGAVLLGKTNLSEWANFRSNRSTSGWSSRGGQTKNPNILNRNPSGSSSGTGAAVSANLCAIGIGTETDGSVVAPSSFCGLVGIKPTVGLLSRSGIIPISKTQDTAGPMARTVRDAAILLAALTGVDSDDEVTKQSGGKAQKDYTPFLDAAGLKGKRIGIEKRFLEGHEGVVALYKDAIDTLKKQGAEVVEVELLKAVREASGGEFTVLQYEFKDGVNKYLAAATADSKVKSLADVIAFNKQNAAKAMPYFQQETLESSNAKGDLNSKEYLDALAKSTGSRKVIDDMLKQNKLDAICGTSIGIACLTDLINGDYDTGFYFCPPAAMAGYPHITVPMGYVHDLPVGFSFCGTAYSEGPLLSLAYAFEQATKKRQPPKFLPSFES